MGKQPGTTKLVTKPATKTGGAAKTGAKKAAKKGAKKAGKKTGAAKTKKVNKPKIAKKSGTGGKLVLARMRTPIIAKK